MPVSFSKTGEIQILDGVPLQESALYMELGDCIYCQKSVDDSIGGTLENIRVTDTVIYADNVCAECFIARSDNAGDAIAMTEFLERDEQ